MLLILVTFVLFAVAMGGLMMILFSKKLWSRAEIPFLERLEPMVIAGFLCFIIGSAMLCSLLWGPIL